MLNSVATLQDPVFPAHIGSGIKLSLAEGELFKLAALAARVYGGFL